MKTTIETKRLIIRFLKKGDEGDLIEGLNNLSISKFLSRVPYPYTRKDALWWIPNSKGKDKYAFAIVLKSEKKLIGSIGLHDVNTFQGISELGYWLAEKYHRQGIMYEAAKSVLDFAFKKLKLRKVFALAYAENEASHELIKKLGFTHEGFLRKHARAKSTGKVHDTHIYGLLREEWK